MGVFSKAMRYVPYSVVLLFTEDKRLARQRAHSVGLLLILRQRFGG